MPQVYHSNARTNQHVREIIQKSNLTNVELANNYNVNVKTIAKQDYENIYDVKKDLNKFLIYYNFNRRHGSLKKELKVRTPFDAVQSWFQTKPEIFKILPDVFKNIAFEMVQRGET